MGIGVIPNPHPAIPHEAHSRQADKQLWHKVMRAEEGVMVGGFLEGGGERKLEFENSYLLLPHAYLGHSTVFSRLMEEAIVDKRNCIVRAWNVNMHGIY